MTAAFEGKTALVTGAGSGIGRACALGFAAEGANVLVVDIDAASGAETTKAIEAAGGVAAFLEADVSNEEDVQRMVRTAVETWGRLDIAHNNAGIAERRVLLADLTTEDWDRVININLKGVWLCLKYEIQQMLTQGGGAIVNTASVVGLAAVRHQPAYVASKHGVVGLTRSAAIEYAEQGIRVNAVCPGAVRTPALDLYLRGKPDLERALVESSPTKRIATTEEIAASVTFLCTDAAAYITGHALAIDGGVLAM